MILNSRFLLLLDYYYSVVLKGNDLTYQLTSHDEK